MSKSIYPNFALATASITLLRFAAIQGFGSIRPDTDGEIPPPQSQLT